MITTAHKGQPDTYQPPDSVLTSGSATVDYVVIPYGPFLLNYSNRPFFTLWQAEAMLWDQQVWFGLQLRNAPLMSAEVEVVGPSEEINQFVREQWKKMWSFAPKIVATKYFGYQGLEIKYRLNNGLLEIDQLRDFHPRDTFPLLNKQNGEIAGVTLHGQRYSMVSTTANQPTPLYGMQGLWLNYGALYSSRFGRSLSEKAYPAWWDKAMPSGAYDMRRLRGLKDAWIGDVLKYPLKYKMTLPNGQEISGKDIVREIMENRASGGVVAIPSDCNDKGQPLFEYQPPQTVAPSEVIRQWIQDSDWDIFDGLLIPKEIVEASGSGGFSGRSFPMIMFLATGDAEFSEYARAIKKQVLEPLVIRNFGHAANDFDVKPIPLLDTFAEKIGGTQAGGPIGGGQQQDGGYHGGDTDGRQVMRQRPESMQFAIADEPPGARKKKIVANKNFREIEGFGPAVSRRLERLLKKN